MESVAEVRGAVSGDVGSIFKVCGRGFENIFWRASQLLKNILKTLDTNTLFTRFVFGAGCIVRIHSSVLFGLCAPGLCLAKG